LKYLLGSLILLNIADGLLTNRIIKFGFGTEGNPFLLTMVGQPYFIIIKIVGVLLCGLILWDIYRRYPRLALVATSCFVAFYGVVVLWNFSMLLS